MREALGAPKLAASTNWIHLIIGYKKKARLSAGLGFARLRALLEGAINPFGPSFEQLPKLRLVTGPEDQEQPGEGFLVGGFDESGFYERLGERCGVGAGGFKIGFGSQLGPIGFASLSADFSFALREFGEGFDDFGLRAHDVGFLSHRAGRRPNPSALLFSFSPLR